MSSYRYISGQVQWNSVHQAKGGMESSPLLNSQRLVVGQAQSYHLALRVKCVEIDVRNHT
jgi:hypothetical protein